jgi:2-oxoglutarate ferredoxin oxidoreductase subunit delta
MADYWQTKMNLEKEGRKLYDQQIFRDWCKGCGICVAFCPKQVYEMDESGKSVVVKADDCIGCRFCVLHCPDFAITVTRRFPDRRKKAANTEKETAVQPVV